MGGKYRFGKRRKQWVMATARLLGYRVIHDETKLYPWHVNTPDGIYIVSAKREQAIQYNIVEEDIFIRYKIKYRQAASKPQPLKSPEPAPDPR